MRIFTILWGSLLYFFWIILRFLCIIQIRWILFCSLLVPSLRWEGRINQYRNLWSRVRLLRICGRCLIRLWRGYILHSNRFLLRFLFLQYRRFLILIIRLWWRIHILIFKKNLNFQCKLIRNYHFFYKKLPENKLNFNIFGYNW